MENSTDARELTASHTHVSQLPPVNRFGLQYSAHYLRMKSCTHVRQHVFAFLHNKLRTQETLQINDLATDIYYQDT